MAKALRLSQKLVLHRWALCLFGCGSFDELAKHLRDDALEGLDSEGVHRFHRALTLHIPARRRPRLSDDDLVRHDHHIVRVTRAMNEPRVRSGQRPIRWKYFQYLSLLFTEVYLGRYFDDADGLRRELNETIRGFNEDSPQRDRIEPLDETGDADTQLNRLSFQMATGSGKTLLMHAQIRQFQYQLEAHGRERELNRILLVTPNEGLSRQHLREFRASGIPARIFDKAGGRMFLEQVVEILEVSRLGDAMGDKVVAVEALEGSNLVLIDEGHRGLSAGDQGAWIRRRDQLCEEGFSFEYSATFGHAIKGRKEQKQNITHRYATSVLFDYSYRWFHGDGFGKDYAIFNLTSEKDEEWRRDYLTAALLTFFQQQRVFRGCGEKLHPFGTERPLWVFVGGSVTKGLGKKEKSDIVDILGFLRDYVGDRQDFVGRIRRIFAEGLSEITGHSLWEDHFTPLRETGLTPNDIYRETLESLFNAPGGGALHVEHLKGSAGELALRVGDNPPFGVINVGAPGDLRKHCLAEGFDATERQFSGSIFHELNDPGSQVHVLIGAKKFTEGWSSWRVTSMGLMNVGRGEGAQIIQLFGRGVRLRGHKTSLKRSSALGACATGVSSHQARSGRSRTQSPIIGGLSRRDEAAGPETRPTGRSWGVFGPYTPKNRPRERTQPARSAPILLMFTAKHTRSHSARTCASPRKLNRRNPSTSLIHPFGASDSHFRLAYRARPSGVASCFFIRAAAGRFSASTSPCFFPSRPSATYPVTPRLSSSASSSSPLYPASARTSSGFSPKSASTSSSRAVSSPWSLALSVTDAPTTSWFSSSTAVCAL